jgi:hypothetical protein
LPHDELKRVAAALEFRPTAKEATRGALAAALQSRMAKRAGATIRRNIINRPAAPDVSPADSQSPTNPATGVDKADSTRNTTGVGSQSAAPNPGGATVTTNGGNQKVTRQFKTLPGVTPQFQGTEHELVHQLEPVTTPAGSATVQVFRTAVDPVAEADARRIWAKAEGRPPSTPADEADIASRLRKGRGMGLYRVGARMQRAAGGTTDVLHGEYDTPAEAMAAAAAKRGQFAAQAAGGAK